MKISSLVLAFALGSCGGSAKRPKLSPPQPLSERAYAHYLRGKVAFFEEDYPVALRELRKAMHAAPREAMLAVAMLDALNRSGRQRKARLEIDQAVKRWPDSAPMWILRGEIYGGLADHKVAARSYSRAIKVGGPNEEVLLAHAVALQALGQSLKAEAAYGKVLALNEDNAAAHLQLAELLSLRRKHAQASEHLGKVSLLTPYDLQAWGRLYLSLHKQGRQQEAERALQRPFDGTRDPISVADALFNVLLDHGSTVVAAELIPILDRSDLSKDTRIAMGYLYLRIGFFAKALALAKALDSSIATDVAVAELRARALRGLGLSGEAKAQLVAIVEGKPGFARAQSMAARILADQQQFEEANKLLRSAMAVVPDDPELTLSLAAVAEAAGKIEEAEKILEVALSAHPDSARTIYALAELHARNSRPEAAVALVQTLIDNDPRDPAALNYVGFTLLEAGLEAKRSQTSIERALRLAPDSAFVLDSYGWLLLSQGKRSSAKPYLERAARLAPAQVEILGHLAELRRQEDRVGEAQKVLKRAEKLALTKFERGRIQKQLQTLRSKP